MLLHWYACIFMNTYCYKIYHISLEIVWWALSNTSLIVQICSAIHEILANEDFIVTDDLISQLFVVAFVHPIYMQIAFIWDFPVQLGLWKAIYWLWRYKLNEVCDIWKYYPMYMDAIPGWPWLQQVSYISACYNSHILKGSCSRKRIIFEVKLLSMDTQNSALY